MNRGVPVDDCIPEVNPFDSQVANAAPQSSQSPGDYIRARKKQAETKTLVEVQIQEKVECF